MISVIVPVYNTEKYLRACAESVLRQSAADLELLLCDDGSADGSPALCRTLEQEDERVRFLPGGHGGVSGARNRGIAAARGDFLAFVDSDDALEPEMLETLLASLERAGADVAECGIVYVTENGDRPAPFRARTAEGPEEALDRFIRYDDTVSGPCNKLYRRSAVGDTRFPDYVQAEDALFNAQVLLSCRRTVTVPDCLYRYLQRPQSGGRHTPPGREADVVRSWREIDALCAPLVPEPRTALWRKLLDLCLRQYPEIARNRPKDAPGLRRELRETYIIYYKKLHGGELTLRRRLGFLLFRLSPALYIRLQKRGQTP